MMGAVEGVGLLLNRLLDLARAYQGEKRSLFQDHIDPLQTRLDEIHNDYLAGFRETRDLIRKGGRPPTEIIEFLRERRGRSLAERQCAEALASGLEQSRRLRLNDELWNDVAVYCQRVLDYLGASRELASVSWYTHFLESVEFKTDLGEGAGNVWSCMSISGDPDRELLEGIDETLNERLPQAFEEVTRSYGALKVRLL